MIARMKICFLRSIALAFAALAFVNHLVARDVVLNVDNHPTAVAAANQANELAKKGDVAGAIRLYTAAFKADPSMYVAIYERGALYMRQHQYEQAIADFDAALRVSPSFILAAIDRGVAEQHLGKYAQALHEFDYIIAIRPRYHAQALALSDRAWLLATCPDEKFRNGKQAVADAEMACRIDSWDNWDYIDTLAAAYAEAGDFGKAIRFEEKAIRKARDPEDKKNLQERLALYQQQRPFRLTASR
jgi:tetratricopeptide (TPR) repeat protein